jgi:hypothetical protein
MSLPIATLTSPPTSYDFDQSHPGITLQMYLNDRLNDCVIAARAHQNVRLAYTPGFILDISPGEISDEYHLEAGPFDLGILLSDSLARWRDDGWKAGGALRKIQEFRGPFNIGNAGMLAGDATTDMDLMQLKSCIITNTGVQIDMNLPDGITWADPKTFGQNADWTETTREPSSGNRHVMLITGYDSAGLIGITWGTKQHMSWAFLQKYYTGIYWVENVVPI